MFVIEEILNHVVIELGFVEPKPILAGRIKDDQTVADPVIVTVLIKETDPVE